VNDKAKDQAPRVNDITAEDFNKWSTNPVTIAYRTFLNDFGDQLIRDHDERWLADQEENEGEARGRALTHKELVSLKFEHMLDFYISTKDEEPDGRETAE